MKFAPSMQYSLLFTWQYFLVHAVPPVSSTWHVLQPSNHTRHSILGMYSSQNGKVFDSHDSVVQLISFLPDIWQRLHPSFHLLQPNGEAFSSVTTPPAFGLTQYLIPYSEQNISVQALLPPTFWQVLHPSYHISHSDKSWDLEEPASSIIMAKENFIILN